PWGFGSGRIGVASGRRAMHISGERSGGCRRRYAGPAGLAPARLPAARWERSAFRLVRSRISEDGARMAEISAPVPRRGAAHLLIPAGGLLCLAPLAVPALGPYVTTAAALVLGIALALL